MTSTVAIQSSWRALLNFPAWSPGRVRLDHRCVLAVSIAVCTTACGASPHEGLSRGVAPGITIRIAETAHVDVSRVIGAVVEDSTGKTILAWGGVNDPVLRWHTALGKIDTILQPTGWRGSAGYLMTSQGGVYLVDSVGTAWAPGVADTWLLDDHQTTVSGMELAVIGGTTDEHVAVTRTGMARHEGRNWQDSIALEWLDPNLTPVVESGEGGSIWERRTLRSFGWQADGTRRRNGPLLALERMQGTNPGPQWAAITVIRLFGQHVVSLVDRTSSERRILRLDETGLLLGCTKPGGRFVLLSGGPSGQNGVAASGSQGGALHLVEFDSASNLESKIDAAVDSCFL